VRKTAKDGIFEIFNQIFLNLKQITNLFCEMGSFAIIIHKK